MGAKLTVEDLDVVGKRVLVRVDFNVPQDEKLAITDDTRIREALRTIKYLLERRAKVILVSHLGRPKGKVSDKLRLDPVAKRLSELLGQPVIKANDVVGDDAKAKVGALGEGQVLLLENVRFEAGEEANDEGLSKALASMADLYVNDAFGTAHRAHASTAGVARFVSQAAAGFLLVKELEYLDKIVQNPERPFTALLGGAKVSSKLSVIRNLLDKVDNLLIGGGMSYTFLRAMNMEVGSSLVEEDMIKEAKEIIKLAVDKHVKWLLPFDHVVTDKVAPDAATQIVTREGIGPGLMAVDIGPKTVEMFSNVMEKSKTIIWNGPMGIFEMGPFAQGTYAIAKKMASLSATTIVGGGDSVAAINRLGLASKFTHISTGGGASLEMLEGLVLPGVAALTDRK